MLLRLCIITAIVSALVSCHTAYKSSSAPPAPTEFSDESDLHYDDLTGTKVAVIVEPRMHPNLPIVVKKMHERLDSTWKIQIFYGNKNLEFIRENLAQLIDAGRVSLVHLKVDNLTLVTYNHLMLDKRFWGKITGEHVLTFEVDSTLCDFPSNSITQFLKYDYIGAPWRDKNSLGMRCKAYFDKDTKKKWVGDGRDAKDFIAQHPHLITLADSPMRIGNSGLSLRRKSVMLKLIAEYRSFSENFIERSHDLFLACAGLAEKIKFPSVEEAQKFSVESIFYPHPLGFHKSWDSLSPEQEAQLAESCQAYTSVRDNYVKKITPPAKESD